LDDDDDDDDDAHMQNILRVRDYFTTFQTNTLTAVNNTYRLAGRQIHCRADHQTLQQTTHINLHVKPATI